MFGLIYPNGSGSPGFQRRVVRVVSNQPQKTNFETLLSQAITELFRSQKGVNVLMHFAKQGNKDFWRPILANPRLNFCQKFEKIFGLQIEELFPREARLLGNIFDDIGEWFNSGGPQTLAEQIANYANQISQHLKPRQGYGEETIIDYGNSGTLVKALPWVALAFLAVMAFKK